MNLRHTSRICLPALLLVVTGARLAVAQATVTVDARALTSSSVSLGGASTSTTFPTSVVQALALPAGSYQITHYAGGHAGPQPNVLFTVDGAGLVGYAPALEGILQGAGTATLTVQGAQVTCLGLCRLLVTRHRRVGCLPHAFPWVVRSPHRP